MITERLSDEDCKKIAKLLEKDIFKQMEYRLNDGCSMEGYIDESNVLEDGTGIFINYEVEELDYDTYETELEHDLKECLTGRVNDFTYGILQDKNYDEERPLTDEEQHRILSNLSKEYYQHKTTYEYGW